MRDSWTSVASSTPCGVGEDHERVFLKTHFSAIWFTPNRTSRGTNNGILECVWDEQKNPYAFFHKSCSWLMCMMSENRESAREEKSERERERREREEAGEFKGAGWRQGVLGHLRCGSKRVHLWGMRSERLRRW